jgi:hypothetical protein
VAAKKKKKRPEWGNLIRVEGDGGMLLVETDSPPDNPISAFGEPWIVRGLHVTRAPLPGPPAKDGKAHVYLSKGVPEILVTEGMVSRKKQEFRAHHQELRLNPTDPALIEAFEKARADYIQMKRFFSEGMGLMELVIAYRLGPYVVLWRSLLTERERMLLVPFSLPLFAGMVRLAELGVGRCWKGVFLDTPFSEDSLEVPATEHESLAYTVEPERWNEVLVTLREAAAYVLARYEKKITPAVLVDLGFDADYVKALYAKASEDAVDEIAAREAAEDIAEEQQADEEEAAMRDLQSSYW